MQQFISGVLAMAAATIGLFFLRFWRQSGDRLFVFFALAFWIFSGSRILLAATTVSNEGPLAVYLLRLLAFVVIFGAIVDKNLPRRS